MTTTPASPTPGRPPRRPRRPGRYLLAAALDAILAAAKRTSRAHEKATGFPNDALVSYIQAAQGQAGCPHAGG